MIGEAWWMEHIGYMDKSFTIRSITCILKIDRVNLYFMPALISEKDADYA